MPNCPISDWLSPALKCISEKNILKLLQVKNRS